MSANFLHRNSKCGITKQVEAHLISKYETSFSFYRVRSINEILNGHCHRRAYIDLCDARTFAEEV